MRKILTGVAIFLITLVLFEFAASFVQDPKHIRAVFETVDHRMEPFSSKDINEDGIRFMGTSDDVQDKRVALFLGDSYTYGYRLWYKQAPPQQFEKIFNAQREGSITAVNFGWITSSPVLSDRLLKDLGEDYNPEVVFLLLDMTDMWDDNFYQSLLDKNFFHYAGTYFPISTSGFSAILQGASPDLYEKVIGLPSNRFFHSEKPLSATQHLFTRTAQAIQDIAEYTEQELGAKFYLVMYPRNYQYSDKEAPNTWEVDSPSYNYEILGPYVEEPFRYFETFAKENNISLISLLDDFKQTEVFPTTFDDDPHFNKVGANLLAQFIYQHCEELNCFEAR